MPLGDFFALKTQKVIVVSVLLAVGDFFCGESGLVTDINELLSAHIRELACQYIFLNDR